MLAVSLAFLLGVVAGLRALTAPALVSWAARSGLLLLGGSWLGFLGSSWMAWTLTVCAAAEMVNDKLPGTPSKTVPPQFIVRVAMGGLSGLAAAVPADAAVWGLAAGVAGAVAGTLGGAWARGALVRALGGKDLPVALLEDLVAVGGGILIVSQMR